MSAPVTMAADLPVLPAAAATTAPDPATASAFARVLGGALDGSPAAAQPGAGNPASGTTGAPWGSVARAEGFTPDLAAVAETADGDEAGDTAAAGEARPGRTHPDAAEKTAGDPATRADGPSPTALPPAMPVAALLPMTHPTAPTSTGPASTGADANPDTAAGALAAVDGPLGQLPTSPDAAPHQSAAAALSTGQPTPSAASAAKSARTAETPDGKVTAAPDAATTPTDGATTSTNGSATQPEAATALTNGVAGRPDGPTSPVRQSDPPTTPSGRPDRPSTPVLQSVPGANAQPTARSLSDALTGTPGLTAAPSLAAPAAASAVTAATEPAATGHVAAAQPELAAALAQLRHKSDGTSELSVSLHPAELGSVGITATVRAGMLTVTVACADPAAQAAVTAALPTLKHDLAAAGFTGIDVAVGDSGRQQDPRDSAPGSRPAPQRDQEPVDAPLRRPSTTVRSSTDRGVDRWL